MEKRLGTRPRTNLLVCIALALITLAVFGPTLRNGFLNFDDNIFVSENPKLAPGLTPKTIGWAFTANLTHDDPRAEYWEPITLLSRLADVQLYGLSPAGHHASNVLLHLAAGLVLFAASRRLLGSTIFSAALAALFLIHPLHVEPVAWLSARKDILSGLFFFATLWAYAKYASSPSWRRWLAVFAAFLCANMSKPMSVSLPAVLLLLDWWPLQRVQLTKKIIWRLCAEKVPLVLIALAVSALAVIDQHHHGALGDASLYPPGVRLGNAVSSLCIYLGETFVPTGLAIFYPHPRGDLQWSVVAASAACVLLISALSLRWARTRPWWVVGWGWFVVTLLPVLGLVQIGEQARADRYTYVALVGIFIICLEEIRQWLRRHESATATQPRVACFAFTTLAALALCSWQLTHYWRDSISVFTRALSVTENNYVAQANLGAALFDAGRKEEGLAHYHEAVRIYAPVLAHFRQAARDAEQHGDLAKAIDYYGRIITLLPADRDAHARLGDLLSKTGDYGKALAQFNEVLHYDRKAVDARLRIARIFIAENKFVRAHDVLCSVLRLDPANAEARQLAAFTSENARPGKADG